MAKTTRLPGIEVLSVETIEQLPQRIQHRRKHFTLLLAWDAPTEDQAQLREWMRPLVDQGLVYFCAWGRGCEVVHDAVDQCDIERTEITGESDLVIMTTWHDDESLRKACWFFKEHALPNETSEIQSFDRFAVAVGDAKWAEKMKDFLCA